MYAGCRCPRCPDGRVLKSSKIEGKPVLSCRGCGGVFVGLELGLRLLAVLRADVPPVDEDAPSVACPVCRAAMRCALPEGVEVRVKVCRRHGVWFDDDDLVIVARAVAKALGKPVPDAVASLSEAQTSTQPSSPASGTSPAAPAPNWSPPPTGAAIRRQPVRMSAAERAGHAAVEVAGAGVDVVGDVAGLAYGVVTAPVRLSLAVVEGLCELLD